MQIGGLLLFKDSLCVSASFRFMKKLRKDMWVLGSYNDNDNDNNDDNSDDKAQLPRWKFNEERLTWLLAERPRSNAIILDDKHLERFL